MMLVATASPEATPGTAYGRRMPLTRFRSRGGWGPLAMENSGHGAVGAGWAELIGAVAKSADRAAFALLFQHFAPRVKGFMKRSGMDDSAAEELAQETLLMVWRKAALFDPASIAPSGWIFTIARNLRIDALRRERRDAGANASDIDAEFLWDAGPSAETAAAASQAQARVSAAVATLPEDQLRVVELSFHQDKAHAEIAEALQIPLGTVKSRLRLAMNRLRILLDDIQ